MVYEFEERAVKALERISERLDALIVLIQSEKLYVRGDIDTITTIKEIREQKVEEERGPVDQNVDLTPEQLVENLRVEKKEDHLSLGN